jgi:adenylate cyclase
MTHDADLRFHWAESPDYSLDELGRAVEESISIDDSDAMAQWALGRACDIRGEPEKAIAAYERAIELNPSLALAYGSLGYVLALVGRPEEGIQRAREGMRLSPRDPQIERFLQVLAMAHFAAGRYEEAVEWAKRVVQNRPRFVFAYRVLAASYAHLGRIEEAQEALQQMTRREPQFSLETLKERLSGAKPNFVQRYVDGLRKAGLSEKAEA